MIKAIALDDEPLALEIINHFTKSIDFIHLEKTFTKQQEAMKYLRNYPVDLIFLDINMPQKNGIDFFKSLNADPILIFTTAYSEFAVEGFNINATDYLLKPFSEERFVQAAMKARNEFEFRKNRSVQTHLMIRADYKLYRIDFENILFIEGLDDYIQIHQTNGTKIVARYSMKSILAKLPDQKFMRIHRSYIVATNQIKSIQNKTVTLNEFVLPIGDTYREDILKLIQ